MITIKTAKELDKMRRAGEILAQTLERIKAEVGVGVTTKALDRIAAEYIQSQGATCSFYKYRDFPGHICTSLNNMVIHGIPDGTKLCDGDILSIDIGVYHDGYHADAAVTLPVGEVSDEAKRLIRVAEDGFYAGLSVARYGNRLGDVSCAIQQHVEAQGFSVVRQWVGHGIGRALHEDPEVPNFGTAGRGVRLQPGMTLAIEPMINIGHYDVFTGEDGWAIYTTDGTLSAHYEHTIALTRDEPLILTRLS